MKQCKSFWKRPGSLTTLGFVLLLMQGCGKENNPQPLSPQDQTTLLLTSGTWKLQAETADGIDQTTLYNGFTILFTKSGFTTTRGGVVWPYHGSWGFDGTTTNIKRNDGLVVQIDISASALVMKLDWPTSTLGGGRGSSTSGQNIFTMVK